MEMLKTWRVRIALVLAVVGPGFITANVDNDAGRIFTYSQAGAQFGYSLLWTMIPITVALVVVQEMAARMGAVTGKGLSDLIREEFGFRVTFWLMLALIVTNFGNVVAEFAGVASSLELFGISRYIVVPAAALLVWLLVVRGTYDSIEKIFLAASLFYVCYILAGLLAPTGIALWLLADARQRGRSLPYDAGTFFFLAWPILAPIYLFSTRGWRAFAVFGWFLLLNLGAAFFYTVLYYVWAAFQ